MIVLYIILGLFALLLVSRWGVVLAYREAKFSLRLRFGLLVFSLPRSKKEKKPREKKPKKKKEQAAENAPVGEKKPFPFQWSDLPELSAMALKALSRVLRSIHLDELVLHALIGASDPYDTAMALNYANAALEILLGGGIIRAGRMDVSLSPDFVNGKTEVEGRISLSLRPIKLIAIALCLLFAYLRWKRNKKKSAVSAERT